LEPTQKIVLWIQLFVGLLTVVWIIFQFAWLRRLNEARLERHLESTISTERDELADERTTTLAELDRVVKSRGLRRLILFAWAHIRLTLSLIMRLLSFGTTRGLAEHNLLLVKVGAEYRARAIFTEIAMEAMKKIKLYEDAIDNKTVEAQNAFIFAGRVALYEKRNAAAVALFKKAKNVREDEEAHVLIGRQLFAANQLDGAMAEYETARNSLTIDSKPATKAMAHRGVAEVYMKRGNRVKARQELDAAYELDDENQNHAGLARTHELIGDLHRPRTDRIGAALRVRARRTELRPGRHARRGA
jgi:tetratricopeptide (TPR) repeat protein